MSTCIIFLLMAAACASFNNLFIRKNLDNGGTTGGYLVVFFLFSLIISACIQPVFQAPVSWNTPLFYLGLGIGSLMVFMMIMTAFSLTTGPSALTFAFQNSGSVFPALILASLFGSGYGFKLSWGLGFGALFVVSGLFWAAIQQNRSEKTNPKWFFYVTAMLLMQTFILTLFQWHCLLTNTEAAPHPLIPFSCNPLEEIWFTPGLFLSASLLQTIYFGFTSKRLPSRKELLWGSLGGVCNGASTFFLIQAARVGSPAEQGIIFPFFAVGVIIICSAWGQWLYKEKIFWRANLLASSGIVIGALF